MGDKRHYKKLNHIQRIKTEQSEDNNTMKRRKGKRKYRVKGNKEHETQKSDDNLHHES